MLQQQQRQLEEQQQHSTLLDLIRNNAVASPSGESEAARREAIEEAEHLTKFASTVHWITQTDPKADDEHAQGLLASPNVKHWSKTRMLEIEGDTSGVTQARTLTLKLTPNP